MANKSLTDGVMQVKGAVCMLAYEVQIQQRGCNSGARRGVETVHCGVQMQLQMMDGTRASSFKSRSSRLCILDPEALETPTSLLYPRYTTVEFSQATNGPDTMVGFPSSRARSDRQLHTIQVH
jgi:hypothetical protein